MSQNASLGILFAVVTIFLLGTIIGSSISESTKQAKPKPSASLQTTLNKAYTESQQWEWKCLDSGGNYKFSQHWHDASDREYKSLTSKDPHMALLLQRNAMVSLRKEMHKLLKERSK